jgi:lia operon protein LiaF
MRSAGEVIGAIVLVVGILALLGTVGGDVGLSQSFRWLWPLLIVGFGLWLMIAAGDRRGARPPAEWPAPDSDASRIDAARTDAAYPAAEAPWLGAAGPRATPWATRAAGPAWGSAGATQGSRDSGAGWGASAWPWGQAAIYDRRFVGEIELAGPLQAGPMLLETLIGEIRLDLTRATFPDGETPIHVSSAIGDIRVLLPPDVPAAVRVSSWLGVGEALGRVSGALFGDVRAETADFAAARRRIRLDARSLIGEVAVRRARADGWGVPAASSSAGAAGDAGTAGAPGTLGVPGNPVVPSPPSAPSTRGTDLAPDGRGSQPPGVPTA